MTKEAYASQIYLSYAAWAAMNGYAGTAKFLFKHAREEQNHMMKILKYILQRGAKVVVTVIPAPPENPISINNCFEKVFEHEVDNTKSIYQIAKLSHEQEDWATWNFMQWFIQEQVEEETFAMDLLDKMKIAGGEQMSRDALYTLDRDMGKIE